MPPDIMTSIQKMWQAWWSCISVILFWNTHNRHPIAHMQKLEFNSFPPGQNGCRFTDDIFRGIVVNEKCGILMEISLKFVPKGPIDNNPALV